MSDTTARGLLLVISGPSGAGKTTIARQIEKRLGGAFSVSATTRAQTEADVDGRDYTFMTPEAFEEMVAAGEFLEHAEVFGRDRYGTPRRPVEQLLSDGKLVILEIDVQGGLQVRHAAPDAYMIFVLPPSEEELLRRLRGRRREDEAKIQRRFEEAQREISTAKRSGAYDAFIINDDLERAIGEACQLISQRRDAAPVNRQ
jgi:guanylate kinase